MNIDRETYWSGIRKHYRPKQPLFLNDYIRGEILSEDDFAPIRELVYRLFAKTLDPEHPNDSNTDKGRNRTLTQLSETVRFVLHRDLDLMTELDLLMYKLLDRRGLLTGIEGFQFPMNVRAVHPLPPDGYVEGAHATDHRHCDPWVGAPDDMINCFLYVQADKDTSILNLYDVKREQIEACSRFRGSYLEGAHLVNSLYAVPYTPAAGQFIIFDTFVPHNTVRRQPGMRLSIDFRMRRTNPYGVLDERWDAGSGGWDYYWYPNTGRAKSFEERTRDEYARLRKVGNLSGLEFREKNVAKLQAQ